CAPGAGGGAGPRGGRRPGCCGGAPPRSRRLRGPATSRGFRRARAGGQRQEGALRRTEGEPRTPAAENWAVWRGPWQAVTMARAPTATPGRLLLRRPVAASAAAWLLLAPLFGCDKGPS